MRLFDSILAVLVAAIWGGNFVSAKFGMAYFPPFFLTAIRFCIVAGVLLPCVPPIRKEYVPGVALLALVLGVLHLALLFVAMHEGLTIAACAIIVQLGVPFSCLLGLAFFKDRIGKWRSLGMVIAFTGMVIVAGTPNIVQHTLGFAVALAGAFCWALANIITKRLQAVGTMQLLAWMALFAVPQLCLVSLVCEGGYWQDIGRKLLATPLPVALSIAYTSLGSTIAGYGLWYWLLRRYQVSQVAPFSLLVPVFGIAFGQLFFSETLTWQVLVGGTITIVGVTVLVVRRPALAELGERV